MKRLVILVMLALFINRSASAELYYLITPVDSISRENLKDAQLAVFEQGDTSSVVCKGDFAIYHLNTPQEQHRITFTLPCDSSKDYTVRICFSDYLPLSFPLRPDNMSGDNYFIDLGAVGLLHKNLSLIAETGLTDADAVAILNGKHMPLSAMKTVDIKKIESLSVKTSEKAKEYLTDEEFAAGKTSVIFVSLFD